MSVTQSGFSPVDKEGKASPTPISRTTTYGYKVIASSNVSVLSQVDGPLANGPTNTPADSDIASFEHGPRGAYVVSMTTPGNRHSKLSYDSAGRVETVTNQEGFSTTFQTDPRGQLMQVQSTGPGWAAPITERFKYDVRGQRVEAVRVDGDASGGEKESSQPQWAQGFDAHGRMAWHASALGIVQQRRLDVESRVVSEGRYTNAHAQSTQYQWADNGSLAAVTDNAGRVVNLLQDDQQRPAGVMDALGRIHTSQGAAKRASTSLAPLVLIDDFGQRVQRLSPDSGITTWMYDAAGQLTGMVDALGNQASYTHDVQGRIAQQVMADASTKQSTTTSWQYEGSRLVKLEHPTQSEAYRYDQRGLRTARIVTIKANDNNGAKEHTAITRYEHDAKGELTATVLPDGSRLVYEKNGQGQLVAVKRSKVQTPWLQSLETQQVIVKDLQRDMIGLKAQTAGNGVQSQSIRSQEGSLARTVHRLPKKVMTAGTMDRISDDKPWKEQVSLATFNAMQVMLGVGPAHAAEPQAASPAAAPSPSEPKLPGAWGQTSDPQAIIDHRYLWDAAGNLRYMQHSAGEQKTSAYAYDMADRLIVAQTKADEIQAGVDAKVRPVSTGNAPSNEAKPAQLEQYFYDNQGRRVLAQSAGVTSKTRFDKASHRWVENGSGKDNSTQARYDQAGQPQAVGSKMYQWDVAGRLIKTSDGSSKTSYAYDHRGLRNTKHTGQGNQQQTTHFLHDESRQLQAELNNKGQLTRQYVYLADQPLVTIDTPNGQSLSQGQTSKLAQVMQDITTIVKGWVNSSKEEQITWLHVNHLGAPEAATDKAANVVWQASYQSFGKASIKATSYTLNIRLPGQYEDQETGLHYNRQRYYDPTMGSYLTPDPSGNPDGPNGYAYVRYNPVKYVDPDGLVLFAFDGTGNTDNAGDLAALNSSESNVVLFRQAYNSGARRYVAGVGTLHRDTQYGNIAPSAYAQGTLIGSVPFVSYEDADMAGNYSGPARITRMINYFVDEAANINDDEVMDIDIIGFSRGAAQARAFANHLITPGGAQRNGLVRGRSAEGVEQLYYQILDEAYFNQTGSYRFSCQRVNFRFMGLWDTVLSTNRSGYTYQMGIPNEFAHVAQAVALNEYRGGASSLTGGRTLSGSRGNFPLISISQGMFSPVPVPGRTRIERGFIGAHADIGGGFGPNENQLSLIALNWMVVQARAANVTMNDVPSQMPGLAVIHDKSNSLLTGVPAANAEDRTVTYANGSTTTQRNMVFSSGMTYQDTQSQVNGTPLINYFAANDPRRRQTGNAQTFATGTVNVAEYLNWLENNGYGIRNGAAP